MRLPSRLWLSALVAGSGIAHFVVPEFYERIVPRALGSPRPFVHASGVAEIVAGTLLALPPTRRIGGWACAAVLVGVFPANVQMALDGGLGGSRSVLASPAFAWARLPLQVPLVLWAAREGRGEPALRRSGRTAPPARR